MKSTQKKVKIRKLRFFQNTSSKALETRSQPFCNPYSSKNKVLGPAGPYKTTKTASRHAGGGDPELIQFSNKIW